MISYTQKMLICFSPKSSWFAIAGLIMEILRNKIVATIPMPFSAFFVMGNYIFILN